VDDFDIASPLDARRIHILFLSDNRWYSICESSQSGECAPGYAFCMRQFSRHGTLEWLSAVFTSLYAGKECSIPLPMASRSSATQPPRRYNRIKATAAVPLASPGPVPRVEDEVAISLTESDERAAPAPRSRLSLKVGDHILVRKILRTSLNTNPQPKATSLLP
jgi:hypothetical protein